MTTVQSGMKQEAGWRRHLRLTGALAGKDIVDAIKTKTTLSLIIICFLMVLFYRYFPYLTSSADTLDIFLYAETESVVTEALQTSPYFAVYTVDSRARLWEVFPGTESVELAVVIPAETAVEATTDAPLTIEGHLMYWVDAAQRAQIKETVETDLSTELGRPVTLNLEGNDVFFDADQFFFAFSSTIALLFVTLMVGVSLIPNLMIEEKQAQTMDLLRVSPAAAVHLVAGKGLTGLFYGVLGSALVLFLFRHLIVQWPLAILTALLAILFVVPIGLWLGMVAEARSQLQLFAWFVILPLLIPVFLVALEGLVPTGAVAVMNWIPTVLLATLFRLSLTPNASWSHIAAPVVVTAVSSLLLFGLVVWVVSRQDRE